MIIFPLEEIQRRGVDACHRDNCGFHTPAGFGYIASLVLTDPILAVPPGTAFVYLLIRK